MPEALQVRLNLLVYLILLLPLILTEEGGARGANRISNEHKYSTSNNIIIYLIIIMNDCCHFNMSFTVTRADLQICFLMD